MDKLHRVSLVTASTHIVLQVCYLLLKQLAVGRLQLYAGSMQPLKDFCSKLGVSLGVWEGVNCFTQTQEYAFPIHKPGPFHHVNTVLH